MRCDDSWLRSSGGGRFREGRLEEGLGELRSSAECIDPPIGDCFVDRPRLSDPLEWIDEDEGIVCKKSNVAAGRGAGCWYTLGATAIVGPNIAPEGL